MASRSTQTALRTFVLGGLLGAGVGLLLAPAPGSETRLIIHRELRSSLTSVRQLGDRVFRFGQRVFRKGTATADTATQVLGRVELRGVQTHRPSVL